MKLISLIGDSTDASDDWIGGNKADKGEGDGEALWCSHSYHCFNS